LCVIIELAKLFFTQIYKTNKKMIIREKIKIGALIGLSDSWLCKLMTLLNGSVILELLGWFFKVVLPHLDSILDHIAMRLFKFDITKVFLCSKSRF